jgi:molecular chaperone GrpE
VLAKRVLSFKGQKNEMSEETIKSAAELAAERASRIEEGDGAGAAAGLEGSSSQSTASELLGKIASLHEELEAGKDKYLRLVAEFDNFRRRTAREYSEMQDSALGKAMQGLFPVLDNLERALHGAPSEGDWTPSDPAGFAKGVRLIRDQMRRILSDAGLEEVPGEGHPFDPVHHDALTQMPHPSVPADHVASVHARGWKKGEKILRHAQVVVSGGPAAEP